MYRFGRLPAVLVLLGAAAYWAGQSWLEDVSKRNTVTVYGSGPLGLTVFYRLMNEVEEGALLVSRRPVFQPEDLAGADTLAFLSPRRPVSPRESQLVSEFVQGGGRLVLSFHDSETWANLSGLFSSLNISAPIRSDSRFENGQEIRITAARDTVLFRKGLQYSFYSPLVFSQNGCREDPLGCYVIERSTGKGEVLILAGIPAVANGLIGRADNRQFAFLLIDWAGKLLVDEYHHFFSEASFWTLFRRPSFILPLAALVGGLLLFFVFGRSGSPGQDPHVGKKPSISYHALGERIVAGVLGRKRDYRSALAFHSEYLNRRYPEGRRRVSGLSADSPPTPSKSEFLRSADELLRSHRQLLSQRGKR